MRRSAGSPALRSTMPYVKRNKNDAADAEAICEAVRRPAMRFVPVKSAVRGRRLLEVFCS
jgi:transposase